MTMTAGSAVVAEDSPPAFGNLHAYKDEIVPWIRRMTDEVHEHGAACMIQITHLGRRTGWAQDDWLPIVLGRRRCASRPTATSPSRPRTGTSSASSASTPTPPSGCRRAGWTASRSRPTATCSTSSCRRSPTSRDDEWGGDDDGRCVSGCDVLSAIRERVGPDFIVGIRMVIDETVDGGIDTPTGLDDAARLRGRRADRLRQRHPRPHRARVGADRGDPDPRHAVGAAPRLRRHGARQHRPRRVARLEGRRRGVGPARDPRGQGRSGRHDPRPPRRPAHRAQDHRGPRGRDPAVRRRHLLPRPHLRRRRGAVPPQRGDQPRADDAARDRAGRPRRAGS